jgi:hypothetical protein
MLHGLARLAGVFVTIFGLSGASAAGMTFRAEPVGTPSDCRNECPKVVVADGVITRTTPDDLAKFIRANLDDRMFRNVIFLNSPGGSVSPAMRLGVMFRKLGSTVIVGQVEHSREFGNDPKVGVPLKYGSCMSACVFALMGGKRRIVPEASEVGVHRIHSQGQIDVASPDKRRMYIFAESDLVAQMRGYARMMGVNPDLINLAESVGPDTLHKLSDAEIRKYHLARRSL